MMMNELLLPSSVVSYLHVCAVLVFLIGFLCFFLRRDYVRQIVGLKLMLQGVSLGLITTGWEMGSMNLPQSIVISGLIIEAVVIGVALTMVIHIVHHPEEEKDFFAPLDAFRSKEDG
jgi:NADH:ubiquinone oxidoreductase subunit K